MATEPSSEQVQTAPATTDQTTAPNAPVSTESNAAETPSPAQALAEAQAELNSFYSDKVSDHADEQETEKTEEQANPEPSNEPAPVQTEPEVEEPTEEPEAEAPEQMRPRLKNPDDIAIASIAKAKGIGLAEAADIYRGKPAQPAEGSPDQPSAPQADPVQAMREDVQKTTDRLAEIRAALKDPEADRFSDEYVALQFEKDGLLEQLADKKPALMRLELEQAQSAQAVSNAHAQSAQAVRAQYPSIAEVGSPLNQAAYAMRDELAKSDPTKLSAPDAPQIIAQMAVDKLVADQEKYFGVPKATTLARIKAGAPAPPTAPAPPSSPSAKASPPRPTVTPASGYSRQAHTQPSTMAEAFASIQTAEQGNEVLRQLYGEDKGHRRGS